MKILSNKSKSLSLFFCALLGAALLSGCGDNGGSSAAVAPVLAEVTPVTTPARTFTPSYTFNSSQAGTIAYGGACSSVTTSATAGDNTITFDALGNGVYTDCTITVAASGVTSSVLNIPSFTIAWITRPLNDTGMVTCGDYAYASGAPNHNNSLDCATQSVVATKTADGADADGDPIPAGQDVLYGRDATVNDSSDGVAGFSFTKLDASGVALANQTVAWDDAGSEAANSQWSCVKDNVTGLIWEVKTNSAGLHDKSWTYSWYSSTNIGGNFGVQDGGDDCFDTARCDMEKYAADVNAENICGETTDNWRVPSRHELLSIASVDSIPTAIDTYYFPNALPAILWSSDHYLGYVILAWTVDFSSPVKSAPYYKGSLHGVRLVRDAQ